MIDGFNKAHFVLTNTRVSQQQRSDSARVEVYTNSSLLVSADIFPNGKVELMESKTAALINTSGERKAFNDCLKAFAR